MESSDDVTGRSLLVAAAYVALLDHSGRVLLQRRQNTGFMDDHWALLAGHLEPQEPVTNAAAREAYEESGVTVDPADLEPLTSMHRFIEGGGQREQRADFFFVARRWSGTPAIMEPAKTSAMDFFALDALPDPVVPHERRVLEALASGSVPPVLVHRTR